MTVATVKIVATRFLTTDTPEVLALKGAWGVGKTFAWNQLVQQHKNVIKLPNYCYVSLFGISSISELRTAIFAKSRSINLLGEKIDSKIIGNEWVTLSWEFLRSLGNVLAKFRDLPYAKNISIGLEALAPHLIRNTIICLDDFERLSSDRIKPDELLGFISELKEEKGCKIILIFNEAELKTIDDYKKYREKVVDIELLFAPTAEEAAELALPVELPHRGIVKNYAVSLGIKNIRILRKIVTLTELIHHEIHHLHAEVVAQAIKTLVLLVWCFYDADEKKPTPEFVIEWNRVVWGFNERKGNEKDPKRAAWAKVLQEYGLVNIDEFDLTIFKVIERGYLEETGFSDEALRLDAQLRASELEQSFFAAWNLFHNTFADNEAEMMNVMVESFKKSVRHISPVNLNGTVGLFRQLGRNDAADELIDYYVENRSDGNMVFDLSEYPFSENITDSAIRERFRKKHSEGSLVLPLIDAVKHIVANNGWSSEHIDSLKKATEDDFYDLFKLDHGNALGKIVKSCIRFEGWDEYKSIGQTARAALVRIGNENQLNAIRVKRYGIAIEHLGNTEAPST